MTAAETTKRPFVDQAVFRDVVGHFMTGVTVITTRDADERYGVTASAVSSLSLDPPMLLVCLNRRLGARDAIAHSGVFAVNILDEDQGQLATQFATRHPDKFRDVEVAEGEEGIPVLAQSLAHLECRVAEQVDAATHTVFLGEVRVAHARPGSPLAYYRGTFGRFAQAVDEATYHEIRERVLDRRVALGESLTVDQMAAELGVGRAPVYHALQKLRTEGLVSPDPDKGYVVTPITVKTAWEAYDARAALECGVVDQTAGRLGKEQIDRLHAAAEATAPWIRDDTFVDLERYLATNAVFHETLVCLAGNETLLQSYRRLSMGGVMTRALHGVTQTDDRFITDHLGLAEALGAGAVEDARGIILRHAELGKERVRIAIEAAGGAY